MLSCVTRGSTAPGVQLWSGKPSTETHAEEPPGIEVGNGAMVAGAGVAVEEMEGVVAVIAVTVSAGERVGLDTLVPLQALERTTASVAR